MIINYSVIKYKVDDNIAITKMSNRVRVILIKPIISFFKCDYHNNIWVRIYNNSKLTIKNLKYRDLAKKQIYIKDSLFINDKAYQGNPLEGIRLGKLKNKEVIVLRYQVIKKKKSRGFLTYNFFKNKVFNQIYMLNNNV